MKAESLEDLAEKIGYDKDALIAPVSELTWAMASSFISGGNAAAYTD